MLPAEESPLPREGGNRRAGAQMPVRLTEQVPETGRTVLSLLVGRGARLTDVAGLWCQRRAPGSGSGGVYPCLCFNASGPDGGGERGVVEFVLVGVELGEVGERLVHAGA
jgi:hypothetical protein